MRERGREWKGEIKRGESGGRERERTSSMLFISREGREGRGRVGRGRGSESERRKREVGSFIHNLCI